MMVLGQYRAILIDTWWYWVSINWCCLVTGNKAFLPVYIEKDGDLVGCYHSGTTNEQTNDEHGKIELLSQWTMDC